MNCEIGNEIVLEDGKTYTVIDILEHGGNKYVYLGYEDEDGESSLLIQKEEKDGDDYYLTGLDSEKEFDTVLCLIGKKHMNDN